MQKERREPANEAIARSLFNFRFFFFAIEVCLPLQCGQGIRTGQEASRVSALSLRELTTHYTHYIIMAWVGRVMYWGWGYAVRFGRTIWVIYLMPGRSHN